MTEFNADIGMETPHTWKSQRPHIQGSSETEREHGYVRHLELGMRQGALGASKGHCRMVRRVEF